MIVHVVFVEWHSYTTAQQIAEAKTTFLGLTSKIPGISGAYWGESMPGGSNGYRNGVIVLANTPADLEAYRSHPDHQRLSAMIGARASRLFGENLVA